MSRLGSLSGGDALTVGQGRVSMLALHGIQGTRVGWVPVAQALLPEVQTVLPNLRGRAAAWRGRGPEDYTLDAYAVEAASVAEMRLGHQPFLLAGWSMGVSVALAWLATPSVPRPVGLVLLSGSPCLRDTAWFRTSGEALRAEIADRERRLGLREAADHDAVAWTWEAVRDSDQSQLLSGVDMPTLILHGSDDDDCPFRHAERLRDGISNSRLVLLEGAGHLLLTQNTAVVAAEIRRFAASVIPEEGSIRAN